MEDVILHLPTVLPEANFTDEFILFSSERSDGFTSNGLVGFVWSLPVLLSSISCMWILLGVIRMGTGWTIAVSGSAGAMLESNWVRVCELEERSLNVSHCWIDRGETSQHDEKDGVKDHWRRFSKVIQRLHCKLCFTGLTKFSNFYFSINILYLFWVILWGKELHNQKYSNDLLQSLWKRFKALQN